MIWVALLLAVLAGALVYWLLVVSEGAYLGRKAVMTLYDRNASSYDRVKQVLPQDDAYHLARPLLARLGCVERPLVLDVGVGTGRLPLALLRQWDFHGRVVGLDLSPKMLAVARRKTQAHAQCVGLVRDDATSLPFADGVFDAVTSLEVLELLPSPQGALLEMVRVLKPGGHFIMTNRVGVHAPFLPGRAYQPERLDRCLRGLGLVGVKTRQWHSHYDLVEGEKPGQERIAA